MQECTIIFYFLTSFNIIKLKCKLRKLKKNILNGTPPPLHAHTHETGCKCFRCLIL